MWTDDSEYPKLSNSNVTIFSNYSCYYCIHHLRCANAEWSSDMRSNIVVSLPSGKVLCQQKIVESPRYFSTVHASCINFTVSAADFFNQLPSFIVLLCSFFKSIFESSKLWGVTKITFTKVVVTLPWKVIMRWNFDHWYRIDLRSHCSVCCNGYFCYSKRTLYYFSTTFVYYILKLLF